MSDLLKVHHTSVLEDGTEVITKVEPYICLAAHGMRLYLKNGKVWSEKGTLADPIPEWLWWEAKKCTPAALQSVGFDPEDVRISDATGPVEQPVVPQPPTGHSRRGR